MSEQDSHHSDQQFATTRPVHAVTDVCTSKEFAASNPLAERKCCSWCAQMRTLHAIGAPSIPVIPPMLEALTVLFDRVRLLSGMPRNKGPSIPKLPSHAPCAGCSKGEAATLASICASTRDDFKLKVFHSELAQQQQVVSA